MLYHPFRDDLQRLLDASRASAHFRADVLAYAEGHTVPGIVLLRPAPRLKVLRLLAQLLHAEPTLCASRVRVTAFSGCADFRGTIEVECEDGTHHWRFRWDCRWRAAEEGYVDDWGVPDQVRAAREFGWRCFAEWRREDDLPAYDPAGRSPLEHGA